MEESFVKPEPGQLSELFDRVAAMSDELLARKGPVSGVSRAEAVFRQFLRLLSDHHTEHRSVGFYADRLCLSPKYFSRLIKEASGHGAPEWIDRYVVLSARNHLRNSSLSVKQIAALLHFPDQPSFTKYFKSHTGLTPVQFRKS